MGEQEPKKAKKHICAGLLAHVDAGKTTLAEALLYLSGSIRRLGRVDRKDAFLDTYEMERARGITIFSKQAELSFSDRELTLLDTPGHVDFSAEMERTLQILDYAILVISGADGVQGHVETLWRLLARYEVPVFVFVNKMDQEGTECGECLNELRKRLDRRFVDFRRDWNEEDVREGPESFCEEVAMCSDALLERYLEDGEIRREDVRRLIASRQLFPCFFGSALHLVGVEEFLRALLCYTNGREYPGEFAARVYKISRDAQGTRLTHMKITGGSLRVKMPLTGSAAPWEVSGGEIREEKADQIRIYSGASYRTVEEALPGSVCAVTGLTKTWCGQGLGREPAAALPVLEPVLTYRLELPPHSDLHGMLAKLRQLEEEEPQLHIVWNETLREIHVQVMGDMQQEVLKSLIAGRFGTEVGFGAGSIVYKETITRAAEGIGHFEPLRHYAEVHLLLEPGEPGSGLQFETACSEEMLDKNWQRLILTHLEEKKHPGVLTGAEITDLKITLVAGRAHVKHTEGGDFRQATYRAVRQGLKKAGSILLEPVYAFRLTVPADAVGRAMTDLQRMDGRFEPPQTEGEFCVLAGSIPAASLGDYGRQVTAYTRGRGKLFCSLKGYEPCHNAQEVIEAAGYDAESDPENPTGSVFCSHGAGYLVPWDEVDAWAHVKSGLNLSLEEEETDAADRDEAACVKRLYFSAGKQQAVRSEQERQREEKELEAIFERTYGPLRRPDGLCSGAKPKKTAEAPPAEGDGRTESGAVPGSDREAENDGEPDNGLLRGEPPGARGKSSGKRTGSPPGEEYLLVDGYNIIFSWEELRELSRTSLEAARGRLLDILSDYQGYRKMTLILVFDAYRVEGGCGEIFRYHNIYVVYTKEAETADQYIEKTVHAIGRRHNVTVATSDALEQVIILGQGARRMPAAELYEEIEKSRQEMRRDYMGQGGGSKNLLIQHAPPEVAELLEEVRLGKRTLKGD